MIEPVLARLYAFLIRLYPRSFRQDFEAEMRTVFGDALADARRAGPWAVAALCGREARSLPMALVREYRLPGKMKEAAMSAKMEYPANPQIFLSAARRGPAHGWGDILLGMLPFLLIGLFDLVPRLLVMGDLLKWEDPSIQVLNTVFGILLIGTALVIFVLALRRNWPAALATWYPIFVLAPLVLFSALMTNLARSNSTLFNSLNMVVYVAFPLALAVLLYGVTRQDPLAGLLAALPVFYLLWHTNMEFVPDSIQVGVKVPGYLLFCLAIAFTLRRGDWRAGLYAILAMNLAVGALYSYAGIYHGGTLPGVALGPSPLEVARSLVPQYLAMGAILLGPLFARRYRLIGRSAGRASRVGYHLALAALLVVILANLARLAVELNSPSGGNTTYNTILSVTMILGLLLYLAGAYFLYQDSRFRFGLAGWVERVLLLLLPLVIPLAFMLPFITWRWPISDLYGVPLLWEVPHFASLAVGMVWLILSTWLVTRETRPAVPPVAVDEARSQAMPG